MSSKFENFFKTFADTEEQLDFRLGHETVGKKIDSVSTGSLLLDEALSCGGNPCGRIIQYYGAPASGKTLVAMLSIREAQKKDPTANQVFIDAEQTFSSNWAEQLGIDTSKLIIIDGDTASNGRKCFELLLGIPKEDAKHVLKGKAKEGLLDKIVNKDFNINLIVLDSLGQIIPPGEDVSNIGKVNMALMARFLTPTFRKLSLEVSKAKIPFIIINHKRDGFDMYGPDHTFSGGNSYAHSLSANIYFTIVGRKDSAILDDNENKIGHIIKATVEKSKFGPHPRSCEFKVQFDIGVVDQHIEVAKLAMDYDIIVKPNALMYKYGEYSWKGAEAMHNFLLENPDVCLKIKQETLAASEAKLDNKRKEQENKKTVPSDVEESEVSDIDDVSGETVKKRGRKPK